MASPYDGKAANLNIKQVNGEWIIDEGQRFILGVGRPKVSQALGDIEEEAPVQNHCRAADLKPPSDSHGASVTGKKECLQKPALIPIQPKRMGLGQGLVG